MKKLTQEVFDLPECPDWAESAAVDSDGFAYLYEDNAELLILHELGFSNFIWSSAKKSLGSSYDTTNWQQSAIDRGEK